MNAKIAALGTVTWTSRAGLTYTSNPEPVTMPGDPDHADALRQELYRLRHPDPEPLRRFNHDLRVRTAQAKIDDNLAALHAEPWRVETWTDTIERPDPDQPLGRHHLDDLDADDPYAQLPLPPLDEPSGVVSSAQW